MVSTTLDAMAAGGIYDHLGGGFARYSTDTTWTVPHFEKMLYDQAALVRVYLHAWQVTGHSDWLQVVEETIGYVLTELASPGGGLCSAQDADSEGEEGRFYVWTPAQFDSALGPSLAAVASDWYGVTDAGNFEGRSILRRPVHAPLARPAEVEEARRLLFEARLPRVHPGLDDKVLTEWNAMFGSSLAEAAAATGRSDWADAAAGIGEFLLAELRSPDTGRWLRSWQEGRARHLAYAGDYAWLVELFTRLAELTGQPEWLDRAHDTALAMLDLFAGEGPLLYTTGHDAEQLVIRPLDILDGAVPAANGVAAAALLRLGALRGDDTLTPPVSHCCRPCGPSPRSIPWPVPTAWRRASWRVEASPKSWSPATPRSPRRAPGPGSNRPWSWPGASRRRRHCGRDATTATATCAGTTRARPRPPVPTSSDNDSTPSSPRGEPSWPWCRCDDTRRARRLRDETRTTSTPPAGDARKGRLPAQVPGANRCMVLACTIEDTTAVDLTSGAVVRLRVDWGEQREPDLSPLADRRRRMGR